jgi:hypothetical protein
MNPLNKSDLRLKPLSPGNVPSRIPRNIQSMITWDVVKVNSTIVLSTTAIVETNFAFSLSQHPQSAQWVALFDQWCIPMASVTFTSEMPPGATGTPAFLTTALDWDNATSLGSIATLQDFGSAQVLILEPGKSVTRTVLPCAKPVVGSTTNFGVSRMWIDSAFPGLSQFGIRSIASIPQNVYSVNATVTIYFAFRNSI